jgi:hypothetical protein
MNRIVPGAEGVIVLVHPPFFFSFPSSVGVVTFTPCLYWLLPSYFFIVGLAFKELEFEVERLYLLFQEMEKD